MANSFTYKDKIFSVGSTIGLNYKIKEGDRERQQLFKGILIKIKGANEATRMITIRKMTKSGVGVERVIPLASPNISGISLVRKSHVAKAKLYYIRGLSDQELKTKLYQTKTK